MRVGYERDFAEDYLQPFEVAERKAPASNSNSEAESHESGLSRLSLSKSMSGGFRVPFKIA
ncbi:MAG: hypothetical protein WCA59_14535, partial [Candidatus Binataceae bacterium]